jgi:methylamine dehydrogenase accessory protein MauD
MLLWLLTILLIAAFIILGRQLAILYERIPPRGARITNAGLKIGSVMKSIRVSDVDEHVFDIPSTNESLTLLIFVSPNCNVCKDIAPAIRSLWLERRGSMSLFIATRGGDVNELRSFGRQYKLDHIPMFVSPELVAHAEIEATPYVLLLDGQGVVRSKGLVNNRGDVESVLNTIEVFGAWQN